MLKVPKYGTTTEMATLKQTIIARTIFCFKIRYVVRYFSRATNVNDCNSIIF